MKQHFYFVVLFILVLSACQGADATSTSTPLVPTFPKPMLTSTKTERTPTSIVVEPTSSVTVSPTAAPSPVPTSTPNATLSPMGLPVIHDQPGELYTTVFSIPVGGDSIIQYRGADNPDMEITGPDAIAILPDDTFMIADLIANRLLHYDEAGNLLDTIELYDLGIVNVADLRISGDKLFLLEISLDFSPPRYRVNQLSFDGKLLAYNEIPEGFHIEGGLTGIAIDCEGQVVLEIAGGSDMYRLEVIQNNSDMMSTPNGYYCNNVLYRVVNSFQQPPMVMAGNVVFETQLTTGFGGLTLLNIFEDGSVYLLRDDVVDDPIVKVDQTVHYISADMVHQGVARVPLSEAYYYIMRNIVANTKKGEVFVLLPRNDSLDVVRLNFYQSLEPLPPSTVIPQITVSASQP
ncbi:MAG: hypothetical protein ACOYYS_21935 [Chloroflexota bacterium]